MKKLILSALVFISLALGLQAQIRPGILVANQATCQEKLDLSLTKGYVANPDHSTSNRAITAMVGSAFQIKAVAPMAEGDFQWAKFSFSPGYPTADIIGVTVHYVVQPSPNNSAKGCYISQTRMIQGPSPNAGVVKIDDGTNLYGSGSHHATPIAGAFLCGNDTKTVMLKLVMNRGDVITVRGITVHFKCPGGNGPIDIVCPVQLPNPKIVLDGTEVYTTSAGTFVRYKIPVTNYNVYPDFMFAAAAYLPACGSNANSARTWVDIYNEAGQRIYGFCALGQSVDLKSIWFAVKKGETPPKRVQIIMNDRACSKKYYSNWISIPQS